MTNEQRAIKAFEAWVRNTRRSHDYTGSAEPTWEKLSTKEKQVWINTVIALSGDVESTRLLIVHNGVLVAPNATINYFSVAPDTDATQHFLIVNSGLEPVSDIQVETPEAYIAYGVPTVPLDAQKATNVPIRLNSADAGTYAGNVVITAPGYEFTFAVTGVVAP